jgi:hypothetical protein
LGDFSLGKSLDQRRKQSRFLSDWKGMFERKGIEAKTFDYMNMGTLP